MPDTQARTGESTLGTWLPRPNSAPLTCANCGTPLVGPFCANCGQHVADFHRSVWRFIADFFDNAICWDNKLFRTLGPLFRQPGFLTHEFMVGRRVRYVHPLRLFLFTSAVCLTLLQYSHYKMYSVEVGKGNPNEKHGLHAKLPSPAPTDARSRGGPRFVQVVQGEGRRTGGCRGCP